VTPHRKFQVWIGGLLLAAWLGFLLLFIGGMHFNDTNETKKLEACVASGGEWLVDDSSYKHECVRHKEEQ